MSDNRSKEYISALEQYVAKDARNLDRHEAFVLVHKNRKDYGPAKLMVCVNCEVGQVIVEYLNNICNSCSEIFTTENSSFSFIAGTLRIKVNDSFFGDITINITTSFDPQ